MRRRNWDDIYIDVEKEKNDAKEFIAGVVLLALVSFVILFIYAVYEAMIMFNSLVPLLIVIVALIIYYYYVTKVKPSRITYECLSCHGKFKGQKSVCPNCGVRFSNIYCPGCHSPIGSTDVECDKCGYYFSNTRIKDNSHHNKKERIYSCENCGGEYKGQKPRCPHCGIKFSHIYCPDCGAVSTATATECKECGQVFREYMPIFINGFSRD